MPSNDTHSGPEDPEFEAMRTVYGALRSLDSAAQIRVIEYVLRRLSLKRDDFDGFPTAMSDARHTTESDTDDRPPSAPVTQGAAHPDKDLDGISPVAQRW